MAEILQNQYRRALFADKAARQEESPDVNFDPAEADVEAQDEQSRRRLLERFRNTDINKKALQDQTKAQLKEAVEDKTRALLSRGFTRVFGVACGATIVLLIVPYIMMTIQMIAGNLLGNPLVPKLNLFEQVLWGVATFVLISIMIIFVVLIVVLVRLMSGDISLLLQMIWDGLTNLLN